MEPSRRESERELRVVGFYSPCPRVVNAPPRIKTSVTEAKVVDQKTFANSSGEVLSAFWTSWRASS